MFRRSGPFKISKPAISIAAEKQVQHGQKKQEHSKQCCHLRVVTNHDHGNTASAAAPAVPSAPTREYSCSNYELCLNLAAALNWESFSCEGCCGRVNETLLWQAHQAVKRDKVGSRICDLPEIKAIDGDRECEQFELIKPLYKAAKS